MINVAICDDENIVTIEVENLLLNVAKRYFIPINIEVYTDGSGLEKDIDKGEEFDIIFLDIEMEQDGILTAKKIREEGKDSLIIYMSNYERYLKELFEVETFRFLNKPIDAIKTEKYFLDAVEKIKKDKNYFVYQYNRQTNRLRTKDIMYFESNKRKVLIHKKDGGILEFYGKLNDIERRLSVDSNQFIRTHQSFLVNSVYISLFLIFCLITY